MIDSHRRNLANLETTVELLNARAEFSTLGFNLKGFVSSFNNLPSTPEENDTYGVGTTTPYTFWVYSNNNWVSLGLFPLPGPKGNPGDKGEDGKIGPVGPKGQKGDQGAVGPAGSGLGVNYVTDLVLSKGESTSVSYNNTTGVALSKQGQIIAAGNTYDITVTDKLPIIPGDNINIYTNGANNAIKIGAKVPVTSVNGQKGDVRLSIPTDTSDLTNNAHFVTEDYHDPSKQNTLVSGQNIKTINNQSILGSGNITISGGSSGVSSVNGHTGAINIVGGTNVSIDDSNGTLTINASGGGGSGTDTGFDNVREIQAADEHTTYNPDTKEYVISSGKADIFYKDGTKTTIPYVQEIGLIAGDNITFTEELIDNTNWRLKINATGGGSSNVQQTNGFYPYKVAVVESPTVGSTYSYDNTKVTYPSGCSFFYGQMIIDTKGAIYNVIGSTMCKCVYVPQGGGGSGSATLYQHTITYSSSKFNERDDFGGADLSGQFSISFYSTHGHFENASDFWAWLIGRGSINVCDAQLWGDMSGGTSFTRITVLGNTDAEKYIQFESFAGNGEWNPIQYFLKNPDATGLTDTIIDGFRDM